MTPLLMGLIGGAGQGLETLNKQNYANQVRADEEATRSRLLQQQSDLKIKEEQTVLGIQDLYKQETEKRAIAAKNQPVNDFTSAVGQHLNDQVPAESPPPVTQLNGLINGNGITGADGQPLNGGTQGFSGNIANLRDQITNGTMPDADKQAALAQLDAQASGANDVNAAMTPPTRGMTYQQAQGQAMQDMLAKGNGPGFAAGLDAAKANTVNTGWGATTGTRDPLTGETNVTQDNSIGRTAIGMGGVEAKQTSANAAADRAAAAQTAADANRVRADAIAHAQGSTDPVLSSLGKTADRAGIVLGRLMASGVDPTNPALMAAQQDYQNAAQRVIDRQNASMANHPMGNSPAPTSATPAIPGLPSGAIQIGTSNGKAVYQLPDGSKVQAQ